MLEQALALMKALTKTLGVEVEPDVDATCGLRIDDRIDLTLRYEQRFSSLLAYATVGTLPEHGVEVTMLRLLEANHVWDGSRGATWSVTGRNVVLSRLFSLSDLDADVLVVELADLVELALDEQRLLVEDARNASSDALSAGMLPIGMLPA